ncbi:hypothetical protein TRFO_12067 [Tritrichomonas foetus]|uniref:Cilia- and flagella-associated protein 36 n=1 Tax=Tritrichomonas foetus TaxID=1144522 RepID=A0A1J4J0E4_9EUKA|nr:hypothetical protein TRFO_12067 [Tritrichomonas foetus]|eukprot:OHS93056.1 hypothetical protein TRFO_12067 [Tritrichomonas foetus]
MNLFYFQNIIYCFRILHINFLTVNLVISHISFRMSNEQIIFKVCTFFASEKWWKPIINFVYTKNGPFIGENCTHEEYEKFLEFSAMVVDLIDTKLCSFIGIPPKVLENVLISTFEDGNIQSRVILDTLQKTMNFSDFKEEMTQSNIRTEQIINELLLQFAEEASRNESLKNSNEKIDSNILAAKVAEETQKRLDQEMNELIEKGCRQMRALLSLDILESHRSPTKRPYPKPNSSSATNSPVKTPLKLPQHANLQSNSSSSSDVSPVASSSASPSFAKNKSDLDPAEVERRRNFYIKQRDILAQKENRTPPLKKAHIIETKAPSSSTNVRNRKHYHKIPE